MALGSGRPCGYAEVFGSGGLFFGWRCAQMRTDRFLAGVGRKSSKNPFLPGVLSEGMDPMLAGDDRRPLKRDFRIERG